MRRFDRMAERVALRCGAMKTPRDLPEDGLVEIDGDGTRVNILITAGSNTLATLQMARQPEGHWEVNVTRGNSGWGPLLYDLALEFVDWYDDPGVSPDRDVVSGQARKVWEFYSKRRPDVRSTPLPEHKQVKAFPEYLNRIYFKSGHPFIRDLVRRGKLVSDNFDF